MYLVKVEVSSDSSKAEMKLDTETRVILDEDDIGITLGKLLFAVEEMGYPFTTDDVYTECMFVVNESEIGARFTVLYKRDGLSVKIKRVSA